MGAVSRTRVVYVPGYGGAPLPHWQRLWAASDPDAVVVEQADWRRPNADAWARVLGATLTDLAPPVVLVAHSLGCATVARWAGTTAAPGPVVGALLVAPTDPEAEGFTVPAEGFAPVPRRPLPFPSVVAAGGADPAVRPERAAAFAASWGSRCVPVAARGHVDARDGYGPWPEGEALLRGLLAEVGRV